eukprot:14569003-Ditylum_brightwellii.AAC.1
MHQSILQGKRNRSEFGFPTFAIFQYNVSDDVICDVDANVKRTLNNSESEISKKRAFRADVIKMTIKTLFKFVKDT